MKNQVNLVFFAILLASLLMSCKTNQSATRNSEKPEVVDRGYDHALEKDVIQSSNTMKPNERAPSNRTLADMLRQTSGVSVTGQGNNVSVKVRGINSFGPSDPLYVINGSPVGNSYTDIASTIDPNTITSITVLKGSDAAIYGSRGGNGVIVIRTK